MGATGLVLTTAGTACAVALAASVALADGPAAPTSRPAKSAHAGHAVAETAAAGTVRTLSTRAAAGGLPRIRGYVGADFTITVNKRRVPRGRYRLVVKDEGTLHNWHIQGRRVDKSTTVEDTGKWVWRVRLRKGTYTIVCDTHPTQMSTSLRVTSG